MKGSHFETSKKILKWSPSWSFLGNESKETLIWCNSNITIISTDYIVYVKFQWAIRLTLLLTILYEDLLLRLSHFLKGYHSMPLAKLEKWACDLKSFHKWKRWDEQSIKLLVRCMHSLSFCIFIILLVASYIAIFKMCLKTVKLAMVSGICKIIAVELLTKVITSICRRAFFLIIY